MTDFMETEDRREIIKQKLRQNFDGRIVRKDLTKKIKEGANVPVYVLEFLLGQYCSSDDPEIIEQGVENVKHILADNFVRPDEAQKILSVLRQRGSYTVIDKITVSLNIRYDMYEAEFSNLGLKNIPISMIGCSAAEFGVLCSWITRQKMNLHRKLFLLPEIISSPGRNARKMQRRSVSGS